MQSVSPLNIMTFNNSCVVTVIVTYNAETLIEKCLTSVHQSSHETKIIVIDNSSCDKTIQIIRTKYPRVKIIASGQNLGFGKANNIGINWAISEGAEFILLLNQDAWIEKDTIEKLLRAASRHGEYGILSPMHCQYDNSLLHKGFIKYINTFSTVPNSNETLKDDVVHNVNFIPAALWFLKSSALKEVGGFDPIYFMYCEDDDLAARMRMANYKIGVVPSAKGHHLEKNFSKGVPVKRLALAYFGQYASVLKYSEYTFLHRYLSVTKSAFEKLFNYCFQGKYEEAMASAIAFGNVLCSIHKIEISRVRIKSPGAFLENFE